MKRILIVIPNWFGETLFVTPFLRSLRQEMTAAHISVMGWAQCQEVLMYCPYINDYIVYDERTDHKSLKAKFKIINNLRAGRFDTAFILRKSLSRSLLLMLAGIPTRVGFNNFKSGWALTHRVPMSHHPQHKATQYLELLTYMRLRLSFEPYEYSISHDERAKAVTLLQDAGLQNDKRMIVLHPGANWNHKRWSTDNYAKLGDRLAVLPNVQVAITGGPSDLALAEHILKQMQHKAYILAGKTTLRELAACLERAALMVSNDTGVMHLAVALERPTVALFGPTSSTLTGPMGNHRKIALIHHLDCCPFIPCYSPDDPPHAGMSSITVDEVYGAAHKLLAIKDV